MHGIKSGMDRLRIQINVHTHTCQWLESEHSSSTYVHKLTLSARVGSGISRTQIQMCPHMTCNWALEEFIFFMQVDTVKRVNSILQDGKHE